MLEPAPLVLTDVLAWLGVRGSIVLVASAIVAAYHGHSLLALFATLGVYARIAGLFVLFAVVAYAGLIPGVHVSIDVPTLAEFLSRVWSWLPIPEPGGQLPW